MSMQSVATTLAALPATPFALTGPEVTALGKLVSKAAYSGAHNWLVELPDLDDENHPFPELHGTQDKWAAVLSKIQTGIPTDTGGPWTGTLAQVGPMAWTVDITGHPDFAHPYVNEWTAINAAMSFAASQNKRSITLGACSAFGGSAPDYRPGSGYTGPTAPHIGGRGAIAPYPAGLDALHWWLTDVAYYALTAGYTAVLVGNSKRVPLTLGAFPAVDAFYGFNLEVSW